MEEVEVPHLFLCPISLELMRDPVTLSTGITYDRDSIERWLFSGGANRRTCPLTKQTLPPDSDDLTPNHTLRRLIQAWCTDNAARGVARIPTPRPPVDRTHVTRLIAAASEDLPLALRKLKVLALESDRNRRCMEAAGAVTFLASVVQSTTLSSAEEALAILYHLQLAEEALTALMSEHKHIVSSLAGILRRGSCQSRAYATFLLKSIFQVSDPALLTAIKADIFDEVVQLLRHQISQQATKAALQILIELCPWGRNRIKAIDSGAVAVLIELLLDTPEKRVSEMGLVALDQLCGCAEGRAAFLRHAAGAAVVSKKMLRVSNLATERAVKILSSIARFSATPAVLQEMMQVGVVAKLCLVVQTNCSFKAREKAKEIFSLHSRAWRSSSCVPPHLLSALPFPSHS